jgi:hypothetical protein
MVKKSFSAKKDYFRGLKRTFSTTAGGERVFQLNNCRGRGKMAPGFDVCVAKVQLLQGVSPLSAVFFLRNTVLKNTAQKK